MTAHPWNSIDIRKFVVFFNFFLRYFPLFSKPVEANLNSSNINFYSILICIWKFRNGKTVSTNMESLQYNNVIFIVDQTRKKRRKKWSYNCYFCAIFYIYFLLLRTFSSRLKTIYIVDIKCVAVVYKMWTLNVCIKYMKFLFSKL